MVESSFTDEELEQYAEDDPYNSTGLRKILRRLATELIANKHEVKLLHQQIDMLENQTYESETEVVKLQKLLEVFKLDFVVSMTDKQKLMWEWLIHRIIFTMNDCLTEQHCFNAVMEADKRFRDIKQARL